MKFIRNVQFHLAVTACVSMVMSPLAMAKETKNLAMVHKKRLEEFQFSKKQTYGEYWKKVRKEYEPKVREKLDHWAFAMRNEKMPDVSYSTFVDRDGTEKLRIHLSKNGKTDTLTIHATDEKALAFNNVNISPEDAASIDTMVMKVMAEDEKKGREMINAPSFAERRPSSSPITLTTEEFFKLSAKDRMKYLAQLSAVSAAAEQVQLNEFKIQELKSESEKNKKPGALFNFQKWLNQISFGIFAFADQEDLRELRDETPVQSGSGANSSTKRQTKEEALLELENAKDDYEHSLGYEANEKTVNQAKTAYDRKLAEFKKKHPFTSTKQFEADIQAAMDYRSAATEKIKRNQAAQAVRDTELQKFKSDHQMSEVVDSMVSGVADECMNGAFFGLVVTEPKPKARTYCSQKYDAEGNNFSIMRNGTEFKIKNECNSKTQAPCHPLLFGVTQDKMNCVTIDKANPNNISEQCLKAAGGKTTIDGEYGAEQVIRSLYGDFYDSACLQNKKCFEGAKQKFELWNSRFNEYAMNQENICQKYSTKYTQERKKNSLVEDQLATCSVLSAQIARLKSYSFPDFKGAEIVADCSTFNAKAPAGAKIPSNGSVDQNTKCTCNKGSAFESKTMFIGDAELYCPITATDLTKNTNPDSLNRGAKKAACDALDSKPGAWEKRLNSFWTKREKYKDAAENCQYSWSEKAAPLGLFTGIGVVLGLSSKAKDAIEKRNEKAASGAQ